MPPLAPEEPVRGRGAQRDVRTRRAQAAPVLHVNVSPMRHCGLAALILALALTVAPPHPHHRRHAKTSANTSACSCRRRLALLPLLLFVLVRMPMLSSLLPGPQLFLHPPVRHLLPPATIEAPPATSPSHRPTRCTPGHTRRPGHGLVQYGNAPPHVSGDQAEW